MFKWCQNAGYDSSAFAPPTTLFHYFYDTVWEDWRVDATPGSGKSKQPATWNSCLFFSIMAVVCQQLISMGEASKAPIKEDESLILIVCYLQRIIVPLRAYVDLSLIHI